MSTESLDVELSCTGCGAKVGAGVLRELLQDFPVQEDPKLLSGFSGAEDASVYQVSEELALVQTLDFFPPMLEDPYLYGRIAATNALSDVYAMGAKPVTALNIFAAPKKASEKNLKAVLKGGFDAAHEAGVLITGGHSIYDSGWKYGLSVLGLVHPERIWHNRGCKAGDILYLTKKLGVGIALTAYQAQYATRTELDPVLESMLQMNGQAAEILQTVHPHAVTDVTGFGLMGHLSEMLETSGCTACLNAAKIPYFESVPRWASLGLLPEAVYNNRRFVGERFSCSESNQNAWEILFDPQTSGGFLFALDPKESAQVELAFQRAGLFLARIGWFESGVEKIVLKGELRYGNLT